jgi:hypothetical protein
MVRVVTLSTFLTSSSSRTLLQHRRAIEGEVEEAFALEEPQGPYLLCESHCYLIGDTSPSESIPADTSIS